MILTRKVVWSSDEGTELVIPKSRSPEFESRYDKKRTYSSVVPLVVPCSIFPNHACTQLNDLTSSYLGFKPC